MRGVAALGAAALRLDQALVEDDRVVGEAHEHRLAIARDADRGSGETWERTARGEIVVRGHEALVACPDGEWAWTPRGQRGIEHHGVQAVVGTVDGDVARCTRDLRKLDFERALPSRKPDKPNAERRVPGLHQQRVRRIRKEQHFAVGIGRVDQQLGRRSTLNAEERSRSQLRADDDGRGSSAAIALDIRCVHLEGRSVVLR